MSALAQQLIAELGELPHIEGADPIRNPLDAFRLDIASQLAKLLGLEFEKVYDAVLTSTKMADFSVAVPRFKLPGKPADVSERIAREVSRSIEEAGVIRPASCAAYLVLTQPSSCNGSLTVQAHQLHRRGDPTGSIRSLQSEHICGH